MIPYKKYPTADPDMAWDGPAQIKAADVDTLLLICAWYDETKADVKGSYKLPHHLAENKNVVWKGVTAAMGALLGARGGVDIPDDDRKGAFNHLAKHYKQFEKDPPEFKDYGSADLLLIRLGLLETARGSDGYDINKTILALCDLVESLEQRLAEAPNPVVLDRSFLQEQNAALMEKLVTISDELAIKTGAVLSAKNKEHLEKCLGHMKDAMDRCQKVLDAAKESEPDDGEGKTGKPQSYYRRVLIPGLEPPGGKPATALEIPKEIKEKMEAIHKFMCSL